MVKTYTSVKRLRAVLLCVAAMTVGLSIDAGAHPLGNFTINHCARIEPRADRILVHYVIDMAEIPAFQELQKINREGVATKEELAEFAAQFARQLAANLRVIVDGEPIALTVEANSAVTLQGAGGLPTLRIECEVVSSPRAASSRAV